LECDGLTSLSSARLDAPHFEAIEQELTDAGINSGRSSPAGTKRRQAAALQNGDAAGGAAHDNGGL